jgi:hypothetical protein
MPSSPRIDTFERGCCVLERWKHSNYFLGSRRIRIRIRIRSSPMTIMKVSRKEVLIVTRNDTTQTIIFFEE